MRTQINKKGDVLLGFLPYNDPQIPPLGISLLKTKLSKHGYNVTCFDANTELKFRDLFDSYTLLLKSELPEDSYGNIYNMRLEVVQNHMMAYLNLNKKLVEIENYDKLFKDGEYEELAADIVYKTLYRNVKEETLTKLNELIEEFFIILESYIKKMLEKYQPKYFGLSVCSSMLPASLFAFNLCKQLYPDVITFMGGGIFADDMAEDSISFDPVVLNTPYLDAIIVGEGEELLLKILEEDLTKNQKVFTRKDADNKYVSLEEKESPDFTDFELEYYPFMSSRTSASCPFNCEFCSHVSQWGEFRQKKANQVVEELHEIHNKYDKQVFSFADSLVNFIATDLATEMMKHDKVIYWDGNLRVSRDVCDIEKTMHWRRGGFYRAHIGCETGSPRLLKIMQKKLSVDDISTSLKNLANSGVKTTTFWIVGFPGETEEDFQATLDFIEEHKDYIYETTFRPYLHFIKKGGSTENSELLFHEKYNDVLLLQTWINKGTPSRQEMIRRLNLFDQHIKKLGIPNPYNWYELHKADLRWKSLHKNAVPALAEFRDGYITECRNIEDFCKPKKILMDNSDFTF